MAEPRRYGRLTADVLLEYTDRDFSDMGLAMMRACISSIPDLLAHIAELAAENERLSRAWHVKHESQTADRAEAKKWFEHAQRVSADATRLAEVMQQMAKALEYYGPAGDWRQERDENRTWQWVFRGEADVAEVALSAYDALTKPEETTDADD